MQSLISSLRALAIVLALTVTLLSAIALTSEPFTAWFTYSLIGWVLLLVAATCSLFRTGLFGVVASLFCTIVIGRLVSTVHLTAPASGAASTADPLLLAETGPGLPHLTYLTLALGVVLCLQLALLVWRRHEVDPLVPGRDGWVLAFIRLYVGLMFIPHFAAHIFAGPMPFEIFWTYFRDLGFPAPQAMVVLAGVVELAVAIGLSFGFLTRLSAAVGALYLYLTMLLGNHFPVGYIWILPTGGYEFGIFWAVMAGVFVVVGGGAASLDRYLRDRFEGPPQWLAALLR